MNRLLRDKDSVLVLIEAWIVDEHSHDAHAVHVVSNRFGLFDTIIQPTCPFGPLK